MLEVINYKKSAVGRRFEKFVKTLKSNPPKIARTNQLIFLCGANQSAGMVSTRRSVLKKHIEGTQKNSTVIYAEGIFNELKKFGSVKNSLDLEHVISKVADKIIIILESESAFCELGAFSHETLRRKLIVVNNLTFKESESFINTGPIAALHEVRSPVLWYKMAPDGVRVIDGIGAVFHDLNESLNKRPVDKDKIDVESLSKFEATKESLYFLHDVVLLCGPVSHEEIIVILIEIFGKKDFDSVKNLLGILREAKLVETKEVYSIRKKKKIWIYSPVHKNFYFEYELQGNTEELKSAFRNYHLKFNSERFIDG